MCSFSVCSLKLLILALQKVSHSSDSKLTLKCVSIKATGYLTKTEVELWDDASHVNIRSELMDYIKNPLA